MRYSQVAGIHTVLIIALFRRPEPLQNQIHAATLLLQPGTGLPQVLKFGPAGLAGRQHGQSPSQ